MEAHGWKKKGWGSVEVEILNISRNELERQAADEIAEWSRLVDKFSHELKKYQQVCYFCGCAMEKENVNKKCVVNQPEADSIIILLYIVDKVYSSEAPPGDLIGSERHFFGKPFGEWNDDLCFFTLWCQQYKSSSLKLNVIIS